jgi:hypothetical protein
MSIRKVMASKLGRHMLDFPESFHMNESKCLEIGHNHRLRANNITNEKLLPLSEYELICPVTLLSQLSLYFHSYNFTITAITLLPQLSLYYHSYHFTITAVTLLPQLSPFIRSKYDKAERYSWSVTFCTERRQRTPCKRLSS